MGAATLPLFFAVRFAAAGTFFVCNFSDQKNVGRKPLAVCYTVVMAIVKEMPSEAIIGGLKGKLDFYYWKGIAVCRSWPKSPGSSRSPAVMAQWPAFAYISQAWATLDPTLRRYFEVMATGTILTGRDLFARSFLSGWTSPD